MTEIVRIEGPIAAQVIVWRTSCDAAALTPDSVWWSPRHGQGPVDVAQDDIDVAFLPVMHRFDIMRWVRY